MARVSTRAMPARRGQGGKAKAKASQPGRRVSGKQSLGGRLVKTLQKTKQREDKRQDKKEARVSGQFAKCMSTYYERTLKEERDFVFSKLAQHDSWIGCQNWQPCFAAVPWRSCSPWRRSNPSSWPCEGQGDEAVEVAQGHQGEVAGGLV